MLDIRQTAAPETETTVVCRPTGSLKFVVLLVITVQALFALGFFLAQCLSSSTMMWLSLTNGILGLGYALLSVWMAVYLAKACVVADAVGLHWRGASGWHHAAWQDVASYSENWPLKSTSQTKSSIKVKALSETLTVSTESWTSTEALRESITRNATSAPQSGWIVTNGPQHLPLECRYDTTINRNILRWMEEVHKYGLLAVAIYFALQWFTTHTLPGWGWLLTPTGLFVVAKQTLPFLLRPTYRATQPRLADTVFADKDGLRFITGGSEAQIAWADITDLYSVGIRSVVVTHDGGEYDFLDTLTDAERLKLVIPRLAVNAGYRGWRTGTVKRQELLSTDGRQSVQCVYRYRSQNNCASMLGLTLAALFVAAVAAGPALIAWQSGSVPGSKELGLAAGGLLIILAPVWLWGNYWRGAIRTNEEGITQQTLLGRRFLAWSQVRTFRWQGGLDLVWGSVEGMNGTIKFWKGIGDADRLADEIAAHGVAVR